MKNDPIEIREELQNTVRKMMSASPYLEEECVDYVIGKLIDEISLNDTMSARVKEVGHSELRKALWNMFTVGRTFPFEAEAKKEPEKIELNIKQKECTHPDHMMTKQGSTEHCGRCGKSWG